MGDQLDRGDQELEVLFWLERVQREAARAGAWELYAFEFQGQGGAGHRGLTPVQGWADGRREKGSGLESLGAFGRRT